MGYVKQEDLILEAKMCRTKSLMVILLFSLFQFAPFSTAMVIFNDGKTHIISQVINDAISISEESKVILTSGGLIDQYVYLLDGDFECAGGQVNEYVVAKRSSSNVTMSGGQVGLISMEHGTLTVNSGTCGVELCFNAVGYINGGTIGQISLTPGVQSMSGPHVTITGGDISFLKMAGSVADIYGTFNYPYGQVPDISGYITGSLQNGDPLNCQFHRNVDASAYPAGTINLIVLAPPPGIFSLTMAVEPNDIGIDTLTPSVGDTNCVGWVNLNATQFIHCPDIYQFDHWVGGVTDTNSANTTILMDSDKIVTAVFTATRECGDECHANNLFGDYDNNCIIDIVDFAQFALNWMVCTKPECDY